ncbi:MAG TPA: EAL domain-containing protein [Hyphomicrobiaceae bacterium]|nr:EAL domain-containing protein [Hyphomicrobiaceae bacterium]
MQRTSDQATPSYTSEQDGSASADMEKPAGVFGRRGQGKAPPTRQTDDVRPGSPKMVEASGRVTGGAELRGTPKKHPAKSGTDSGARQSGRTRTSGGRFTFADLCVMAAMVLVAAAIGVALTVQAGHTPAYAGLVAFLLLMSAMSGHFMLRREATVAELSSEVVRLEEELSNVSPVARRSSASIDAAQMNVGVDQNSPAASRVRYEEATAPPQQRQRVEPPVAVAEEQSTRLEAHIPMRTQPPALPTKAARVRLSERQSSAGASTGQGASRLPANANATELDRAEKAQKIDSIIRRLADDIAAGQRGGSKTKSTPIGAIVPGMQRENKFEATPVPLPTLDDYFGLPPMKDEAANVLLPVSAEDQRPKPPSLAPIAAQRIAAVADALTNESIDVFLEPILGLDDQRACHYEVSVRLKLQGGDVLDQAGYSEATRGSGLLPLIDAVKISHTKRLAVELTGRGRAGSFFSQVDGEALETKQFGDDVSAIMKGQGKIVARLVLAFSQQDVRQFTMAQWTSLEELKAQGFRFAVESVTDLDMDFEDLSLRGFAFAKLDAEVFIAGLTSPDGHIPAPDICQHLAGAGLTLIVQSIASERQLAEVLGFGVLFGQGALFGGARPIKAQVLRRELGDDATATA